MIQNDLSVIASDLRQGRFKPALKQAKTGMKRHPSNPAYLNFAGIALCGLGREKEAVPLYRKALKLNPADKHARRNLVQALITLKQHEQAAVLLEKLVEASPDDPQLWHLLAVSRYECDQNETGLEASNRALELAPGNAEMLGIRAGLKQRLGQVASAIADCEAALQGAPDDPELFYRLSQLHADRSDTEAAQKSAQRAVEISPQDPRFRSRLAVEQIAGGDKDGAIETIRKTLELAPQNGSAIEQLSRVQSAEQNTEFKPYAEKAFQKAPRGTEARARIGFGLAQIAKGEKDLAAERRYLELANGMMAKLTPYDPDLETQRIRNAMSRFTTGAHPDSPTEPSVPRPVYVVGLPRSGTTLTETMIGAHPDVFAMGERTITASLKDFLVTDKPFDAAAMAEFRALDAAERSKISPTESVYSDKLPENYKMIGFLISTYPDCCIINIKRDPRDNALSMWRANFARGNVTYTYDQKGMAHHFNCYRELMAHWYQVYPGRILDMPYETLTQDPVAASKLLAEHCRLEWVPEMARPDQHAGRVLTFTAHQLRQPVHQKSVGGWRKHADMLRDFIDGLDPELWPEIIDDP